MNTIPRSNEGSQPDIFKSHPIPSRGFISEVLELISQPVAFFTKLGSRQTSPHTLWIALLIIIMTTMVALQTPVTNDGSATDNGGMPFEDMSGGGSMPFEPGFPPDGGGIDTGTTTQDPTARWTLVLTTIAKQIAQWGALTILLSLVTLLNGYMPPFAKNLEVAIWASFPLALMAGLQLAFISGGGAISAQGLSGFLDEWETFANLNLHLQSVIHALSGQVTLFWLWILWLLAIGMRFTLRGKLPVVIFTLVMWVVLLTLVNSLRSYSLLSNSQPIIEDTITLEDNFSDVIVPDENLPSMDDVPLAHEFGFDVEESAMLQEGA